MLFRSYDIETCFCEAQIQHQNFQLNKHGFTAAGGSDYHRIAVYEGSAQPDDKVSRDRVSAITNAARSKDFLGIEWHKGSQGMSKEDLFTALAHRRETPDLEFIGIHYFVGTQRKKLVNQQKELAMLRELYAEIEQTFGLRLPELEYGPGLAVPYFDGDDFTDTLSPAKDLAPALREVSNWVHLTVEMGRFYTAECGYYLTTAMDCKDHSGQHYCIVDGGMNHLNYLGQIMGMKRPHLRHFAARAASVQDWTLCGSLCTTNDVLVRSMPLAGLCPGDLLVFENTGAYSVTEGLGLFLSRDLPQVILWQNGTPHPVRSETPTYPINTPAV